MRFCWSTESVERSLDAVWTIFRIRNRKIIIFIIYYYLYCFLFYINFIHFFFLFLPTSTFINSSSYFKMKHTKFSTKCHEGVQDKLFLLLPDAECLHSTIMMMDWRIDVIYRYVTTCSGNLSPLSFFIFSPPWIYGLF